MRLLWLVVVVALAGCTQGEPELEDPLVGWCPQWVEGETLSFSDNVSAGQTQVTVLDGGNGSYSMDGHALDVYRITVTVEGQVELRATTQNGSAILRDLRQDQGRQVQPMIRAGAGTFSFEAALHPVDAETLHGGPLRLHWSADGPASVEGEAVLAYRVCSARL